MKVEIYSKPQCPYCDMAKRLAEQKGFDLTYKMLNEDFDRETLMETFPGARTFPQIIVDGEKIGGYTEFKALVDASEAK
jgi:glutaredoxin 3